MSACCMNINNPASSIRRHKPKIIFEPDDTSAVPDERASQQAAKSAQRSTPAMLEQRRSNADESEASAKLVLIGPVALTTFLPLPALQTSAQSGRVILGPTLGIQS